MVRSQNAFFLFSYQDALCRCTLCVGNSPEVLIGLYGGGYCEKEYGWGSKKLHSYMKLFDI